MNLINKVAVVTGSGQGLGLAYAKELARQGAAVVVNDVNTETAAAAVDAITSAGCHAVAVVAPVGSTETAELLIATAVDQFGRLDVMVTNAGILRDRVLWKMTDEDFDSVINVHLRGTFTCVRAAVQQFRDQGEGGRIIAIGSPAGQRGNFGQTNYSAAKAAIVGMVRTWALELGRAKITVNAVCPVAVTAMTETVPIFAPFIDEMKTTGELPAVIRREVGMGAPEDVAGLIAFLASDDAANITGQAFAIGGDRLALWSHPRLTISDVQGGGFAANDIAARWPTVFADHLESVGEEFPDEVRQR